MSDNPRNPAIAVSSSSWSPARCRRAVFYAASNAFASGPAPSVQRAGRLRASRSGYCHGSQMAKVAIRPTVRQSICCPRNTKLTSRSPIARSKETSNSHGLKSIDSAGTKPARRGRLEDRHRCDPLSSSQYLVPGGLYQDRNIGGVAGPGRASEKSREMLIASPTAHPVGESIECPQRR